MEILVGPRSDLSLSSTASSWVDSFRNLQSYLLDLPCSSTANFSIAGNTLHVEFGSERFKELVSPALRHLECAHHSADTLTVLLHDLATAPRAAEFLGALSMTGGEMDIWLVDGPDLMLIVQRQGRLLTAVDWRTNTAYWIVPDAASIPYIERAAPLRLLLSYWLGVLGRYLAHAAAVGTANGGALIVGHGGAGKSTSALACLNAGLEYASDDHCLVSVEGEAAVHSIFGTGKLAASHLGRFPSFIPAAEMNHRPEGEKVVFFFDRLPSIRIPGGFSLKAILLARITGSARTGLRRISNAEAFKAIAASCALHFPAARLRALGCFNTLARQLPAYVLELGSDVYSTPDVIRGLLDETLDSKGMGNGCKVD